MKKKNQLEGFKALVASDMSNNSQLEDVDGNYRSWDELSLEGKVRRIAGNAAYYDVPFEPFAEEVREVLGVLPPREGEEAAWRLVLRHERELHALEKLLPDDGRVEPYPPLVKRF